MDGTVYTTGTPALWDDILDFANYVFSQAHQPHDFRTLIPSVYGRRDPEVPSWHFIAVRDGHIKALVADRPRTLTTPGGELKVGCVGTVSVHPYARSEGHMKRLMADMIADARAKGYDLLMLGGQRQRYNYFGFDQAGWSYEYTLTGTNVRHCLKDVDASGIAFSDITGEKPDEVDYAFSLSQKQAVRCDRPKAMYLDIMHNWNQPLRLIRDGIKPIGYIVGDGSEIALEDEADLPRVIKALLGQDASKKMHITCGPHERARIATLSRICGGRSIDTVEMINVLNWPRVIAAMLRYKASFWPLEDGAFTIAVDGGTPMTMRVKDQAVSVNEEGLTPDLTGDHLSVQRALFDIEGLGQPGLYKNWFPLPFYVTSVDTF